MEQGSNEGLLSARSHCEPYAASCLPCKPQFVKTVPTSRLTFLPSAAAAVCPDPGIPAGSRRTGRHFDIDDKVAYRCDNGLILIGSAERVCQESGEWTGIEPACYCEPLTRDKITLMQQYKHTYDTPQEVAKAFSKAISSDLDLAVLDESRPEDNSGTNIAQAFHTILERMSIVKERQKATFKDVRHVIILFSDGIANMGGSADDNVAKIKYLVESVRGKDWEDYLAYKVKSVRPHKNYNNQAKKDLGIPEFYDYDVALIELEKDVTFSANIRPICIPCTKEASHALGLPDTATCKDQEELLLKTDFEYASFMSKQLQQKNVTIKLNSKRDNCIEDALETIKIEDRGKVKAKDIVTDNFLCTGGIDGPQGQTDDISCKGESGGALFVQKKRRLIQVGIISWGVKNLCQVDNPKSDEKSRDFHINLFRVTDFLKERLGKTGETYAPLTFIK
ncbi:complement factor B-like [Scleropages formosus]|uniref:Complement factor B-like n=1 Tax=Scleropages formosus TaxID=113540 RepID=A0A0P7ZCW6_SCLFO|nr:complement factor B-like [Scleropages formosus]